MLMGSILIGIGVLSIVYFVGYVIIMDLNNVFTYFWLLLGLLCIGGGFILRRLHQKGNHAPGGLVIFLLSVAGVAGLVVAVVLGMLIQQAYEKPQPGAEYMVVLGARVKGTTITTNLRYRLEAALTYLEENPETVVVVSGGQGKGEDITEAEAMSSYFLGNGISENRIIKEETSVNTDQNIRNSMKLIGEDRVSRQQNISDQGNVKSGTVVIVSNGFHLFRAKGIARKQGYDKVEGLSSKTKPYTLPNCYMREVFAVLKYKLSGQI